MDKALLQQIKKGIEVEMEHTDDPKMALKIAMDHIKEDPKYYDKLTSRSRRVLLKRYTTS